MIRIFSVFLIIAGVAMMLCGMKASDSLDSSLQRIFTGTPSDKSIGLLIGGLAISVTGLFSLVRVGRSRLPA